MEARSISRYIRQSPKKVRIVLDKIRGKRVGFALDYLHFSPLKASYVAEKTIRSAVANLMQLNESANIDPDSFIIKEAFADGGPHLKRFRAASMGRISRLNTPTSHLTIILSDDSEEVEIWDKKHIQLDLDYQLIRIGGLIGLQKLIFLLSLKKT